jgi:lysophospholipase L1-like esterase
VVSIIKKRKMMTTISKIVKMVSIMMLVGLGDLGVVQGVRGVKEVNDKRKAPTPVPQRSVIIGDSMYWSGWLFWGGQPSPLSKDLETWAGHSIENHALVGASLEEGWVKSIPQQYRELNKVPTITTLIMDGGGNDIISHRSDCEAYNPKCVSTIDQCVDLASQIFVEAGKDGITSILYLGFYYLSGLTQAVDEGNTRMGALCHNQTDLNCYFIDPRYNETTKTGLKTPEMLGPDGLHPNEKGYEILARMIWEKAQEYNVTI